MSITRTGTRTPTAQTISAIGRRGFISVEILVAISIFTVLALAISFYFKEALTVSDRTTNYIQSSYLLEEGAESLKYLRNKGWAANIAPLSTSTIYYFYWSGSDWRATTTAQYVENFFVRSFTVSDIKRDAGDDIVSSGGTYDPNVKLFTLNVAWPNRGKTSTTTVSAQLYVANILGN